MATLKISNRTVEALRPQAKTFVAYDEALAGFGVRVTSNGTKSWIVEYRAGGGGRGAHTRRITIANAALIGADQARREARNVLARVRLGADPAAERADQRSATTFAQIADDYMEREIKPKRADKTANLYELVFRLHILPEIGAKRAREINHADIDRLHRKVGADAKVTANRAVVLITAVFNWAGGSRDNKSNQYGLPGGFNPALGIKRYPEESRERFLTGEELLRLGEAIREAETVGIPYEIDPTKPKAKHAPKPENRRTMISPHVAAALRLLLFTGARLREILHLKWDHVDFERGILLLPKSKTGKKTIVLNGPALAILSNLPRLGEFVVAGQSAGGRSEDEEQPRADLNRPWRAVRRRAGLGDLRIHDLRHSFASVGVGGGMGLPIIGKLLGHRHTATTEKYAHLDTDPLRKASNRIGESIAAAMGEAADGADVVPFRRATQ